MSVTAATVLHAPAPTRTGFGPVSVASGFAAGITGFIRARMVYARTLSQLEAYSERTLEDIGVNFREPRGIEDFARRAAGL